MANAKLNRLALLFILREIDFDVSDTVDSLAQKKQKDTIETVL